MTPQEEIEYIVNAAYLRGCGSAYATAIAGMQEREKDRLSMHWLIVEEDGEVVSSSANWFCHYVRVRGCIDKQEAEDAVRRSIKPEERERLSELVRLMKGAA